MDPDASQGYLYKKQFKECGIVKRKFSVLAVILESIGLFLAIQPFSPLNLMFITNWYSIFIGFSLFIIGVIFSVMAIIEKEKGLLKFFSLMTIPIGILFPLFLFAIIGQV